MMTIENVKEYLECWLREKDVGLKSRLDCKLRHGLAMNDWMCIHDRALISHIEPKPAEISETIVDIHGNTDEDDWEIVSASERECDNAGANGKMIDCQ